MPRESAILTATPTHSPNTTWAGVWYRNTRRDVTTSSVQDPISSHRHSPSDAAACRLRATTKETATAIAEWPLGMPCWAAPLVQGLSRQHGNQRDSVVHRGGFFFFFALDRDSWAAAA